MPTYCRKCGTQLKDGAQFCGNCGAKIQDVFYQDNSSSDDQLTLTKTQVKILRESVFLSLSSAICVLYLIWYRVTRHATIGDGGADVESGILYFIVVIVLAFFVVFIVIETFRTWKNHRKQLILTGTRWSLLCTAIIGILLMLQMLYAYLSIQHSRTYFSPGNLLCFFVIASAFLVGLCCLLVSVFLAQSKKPVKINMKSHKVRNIVICSVLVLLSLGMIVYGAAKVPEKFRYLTDEGTIADPYLQWGASKLNVASRLGIPEEESWWIDENSISNYRFWDPTGNGDWNQSLRTSYWFTDDELDGVYCVFVDDVPQAVQNEQVLNSIKDQFGAPYESYRNKEDTYYYWLTDSAEMLLISEFEKEDSSWKVEFMTCDPKSSNLHNLIPDEATA